MSEKSSASSEAPREEQGIPFLGLILLWLLLALTMFKLPASPSVELDPSWRMAIGQMAGHHLQWGVDVVFTYGPLGYLLAAINHGEHFAQLIAWQCFSTVLFTTAICWFGRRLRGWGALAYFAYFFVTVATFSEAMSMTMVFLLALQLLEESTSSRRWLAPLTTAVMAMLALMKFTNLILAAFCIACIGLHHFWRKRRTEGAVVIGSFVGWFAAGWLACGQHLANIPAYFRTSLLASGGFTDGMALDESGIMLAGGLLSAAGVAALYLLVLWRTADFARSLAKVAICAALSFLNWKHGFARADAHVLSHFSACLLIVVISPVFLGPTAFPRLTRAVLLFTAGAGLFGFLAEQPETIIDAPANLNRVIKHNVHTLRRLPKLEREAEKEFAGASGGHALSAIRDIVGDATIDMIGNAQGYVVLNQFNYRPRPLFQTYLPYSAELARLNERYLESDDAPGFLLVHTDPIDGRLPTLEDALSLRQLVYRYHYLTEESGFQLWQRNDEQEPIAQPELVKQTSATFDDTVNVPNLGANPVWMEIDIRPSLLGRLRSFLYKSPLVHATITDTMAFQSTYRLIPAMARAGCFVSPNLTNEHDIRRYVGERFAPRAAAIALSVPPEQRKYFSPDIGVRFYRLPEVPRTSREKAPEIDPTVFGMFDRLPQSASAMFPLASFQIGGRDVLAANPPSEIVFLVDFPASKASGQFGIADGAYQPPNATDGADFIVEWIAANGDTRIVFQRSLRPMTIAKDRGMQSFEVDLPPGGGRLALRITPGPSGSAAYDWTYWTNVRFRP